MANHYFRFKQFTVYQERTAMRVCTDACIQGAYTASQLAGRPYARMLDIGAGTGLLSLMLAQQHDASIDALELDDNAYTQADENFKASPWANRLHVLHQDARNFHAPLPYDVIITNPPFYEQALKSGHAARDAAMHATTLSFEALTEAIDRNLSGSGICSVLLPYSEFEKFRTLAAKKGLALKKRLDVQQSPRHGFFRTVGLFTREAAATIHDSLLIYDGDNKYTPAFTALLKDYYLYL